jgi:alpha-beta hydrolase superfamily lysophospholipase
MTAEQKPPSLMADTIVLIHGLWVTPKIWEQWIEHYRRPGYEVLTPGYPGLDSDANALRDDPSPIERLTVEETAAHYEAVIRGLPAPPIIVGHCFGGALVQLMLDRGLGAAGVAIHSVPVRGVEFPSLANIGEHLPPMGPPATGSAAIALSAEQFGYAFTNACTKEEARDAYERFAVPAPARILWDAILDSAGCNGATTVNFAKSDRAPLLFVAGGADNLIPASVNRSNYEIYAGASEALVAFREFPGRCHFTLGQAGWQDVADYALRWVMHAESARV